MANRPRRDLIVDPALLTRRALKSVRDGNRLVMDGDQIRLIGPAKKIVTLHFQRPLKRELTLEEFERVLQQLDSVDLTESLRIDFEDATPCSRGFNYTFEDFKERALALFRRAK